MNKNKYVVFFFLSFDVSPIRRIFKNIEEVIVEVSLVISKEKKEEEFIVIDRENGNIVLSSIEICVSWAKKIELEDREWWDKECFYGKTLRHPVLNSTRSFPVSGCSGELEVDSYDSYDSTATATYIWEVK